MPTPPTGSSPTRRTALVLLIVLALVAGVAVVYGIVVLARGATPALGLAFVLGGLTVGLFSALLYTQVVLLQKFASYTYRAYETLLTGTELQRQHQQYVRLIAENSNLSEWAKRIVYREKDYEFLRDTINGALVRQDWETAEHLIRDVETEFGYRDEAAQFRQRLEQARKATVDERYAAAVQRFDMLCEQHKWAQARTECQRLQSLYPDEPRIRDLSLEIERRRQEVKDGLLKEYDQAVRGEDIERAHRLLFALDQYLVPQEAEPLKESAREVFRARMEQIKTRFTIAVSYKQFHNAIDAGEQLIREFPNSGYAQEISKLMPILRQRARQQKIAPHAAPAAPAQNR